MTSTSLHWEMRWCVVCGFEAGPSAEKQLFIRRNGSIRHSPARRRATLELDVLATCLERRDGGVPDLSRRSTSRLKVKRQAWRQAVKARRATRDGAQARARGAERPCNEALCEGNLTVHSERQTSSCPARGRCGGVFVHGIVRHTAVPLALPAGLRGRQGSRGCRKTFISRGSRILS